MKPVFFLSLAATTLASAVQLKGFLPKDNLPSSGKDWVTLDNGVEFQPAEDVDPRLDHVRKLWGSNGKVDDSVFVDGSETYYDDYAQAWRLLGFYIDCNHCDDGSNEASCAQQGKEPVCQRYLLWAAYVDLDYSGQGAGEYMYYDRSKKSWNNAACKESGSSRCVRMDCHEPNSHFKLLGIFKEPDYATFIQQLVTYQGDCIWTDEQYSSMSSAVNFLPQGCTLANNGLYYDMKPESGGSVSIGLYTDAYCVEEYDGDITVGETLAGEANDDDTSQQTALNFESDSTWNDAFDAFKICQPCKATNIASLVNEGSEIDRSQNGDDDGAFSCQSGNADLNQCTQFQGNTNMYTASYKDIMAAEEQGTVSSVKIGSVSFGVSQQQENNQWKRNFLSALFMIGSFFAFIFSLNRCQNEMDDNGMKQPLVEDENDGGNGRSRRNKNRRRGTAY